MNIALWVAAGLLATVALFGGAAKTFVAREKLAAAPGGEWTRDASDGFVKTLGVLEILAAAGLILPLLTGIAPAMVAVTAGCWVLLMIGAMVTHSRIGGIDRFVLLNLTYLVIAGFIVWGRFPA